MNTIHDLEVCQDCVLGIAYGHSSDEWRGILPEWDSFVIINGRSCPEPFQTGTIIHGTMRFCDVAPALIAEIERVGGMVDPTWLDCPDDEQGDVLSEIHDELDSLAPEGYYFGAHPGDGSDLGLWQVEDDRDEFRYRHTCDCCGLVYGGEVHYASAWKR